MPDLIVFLLPLLALGGLAALLVWQRPWHVPPVPMPPVKVRVRFVVDTSEFEAALRQMETAVLQLGAMFSAVARKLREAEPALRKLGEALAEQEREREQERGS